MPSVAAFSSPRLVVYRFAGVIFTSSFPGIEVGDRFFGRLRYDPGAALIEATAPDARYADPNGYVDAVVGAIEVRSQGALEIQMLDSPSIMRLSLMARRASTGEPLIGSCGVFLLSNPPALARGLPPALDAESFVTRSFTVESADFTGFAEGALDALYPLESDAASSANDGLTGNLLP